MDVRDGIRHLIVQSGMKQAAVARKANLDPGRLSEIVNKRRRLDTDVLFDLCGVLHTTPDEVYRIASRLAEEGKDEREREPAGSTDSAHH